MRRAPQHNARYTTSFGMLNSQGTYEGLLKLNPKQRPFVLTRASYAGGQRYSATWTGDNSSTWNHLRMSIPMLLNLGLSGFSLAGDDIGGFAGSPSMDLLTKWIEVGAFNPIFRDHTEKGSHDQEPWAGGSQHEAIRRRFNRRAIPAAAVYLYAGGREFADGHSHDATLVSGISQRRQQISTRWTTK